MLHWLAQPKPARDIYQDALQVYGSDEESAAIEEGWGPSFDQERHLQKMFTDRLGAQGTPPVVKGKETFLKRFAEEPDEVDWTKRAEGASQDWCFPPPPAYDKNDPGRGQTG